MSFQCNAEAIFAIGVQIEKNGEVFYRELAKRSSDEKLKAFFTELAEWEVKHVQLFQQLQDDLPDRARHDDLFDPNDEMASYLKAAADSHVFASPQETIGQIAKRCASPFEALDMALVFEKDSVVYYLTMKKAVSEHFGQEKIDVLIDEELKHISILMNKKQQLSQ